MNERASHYSGSKAKMKQLRHARRAAAAIAAGHFKSQMPIVQQTKKGEVILHTDEHVKANTTMETLAKMKPAFKKDGSVTAGNASGINDGAAVLMLADADAAKAVGSKPLARLVSYAVAGVPNEIMGEGPIPATRAALKKAGLKLDQFDLIESQRAFAAQAIAVARGLEFDIDQPQRRRDRARPPDRLLGRLPRDEGDLRAAA